MIMTRNAGDIQPNSPRRSDCDGTPKRDGKGPKKRKKRKDGLNKMRELIRRNNLEESTYPGRVNIKFKVLEKNKVPLTDDERNEVMNRKAVWHHGPNGEETPAVWKSKVNGKEVFITNTHRAYNATTTLKGAIKRYHDFIKGTA